MCAIIPAVENRLPSLVPSRSTSVPTMDTSRSSAPTASVPSPNRQTYLGMYVIFFFFRDVRIPTLIFLLFFFRKKLRTHTGARPYSCTHPGCAKTFARPDQLARHMSVHRKKAGESPPDQTKVAQTTASA